MAKDDKPLDGFDVLADFLVGPKVIKSPDDTTIGGFQDIDPEDLKNKLAGDTSKKDVTLDKDKKDDKDISDVKPDLSDNKDNDPDNKDDKSDEDKEYESEISTFFGKQLVDKLGVPDLTTDEVKFESIEDVIELMSQVVAENSKPTYSSKEVEEYDEFVKNGGTLRDFYNDVYAGKVDVEKIDIENEFDQKAIVREHLLNQGVKDEKIKKILDRYSEAETLKEEAEDALDLVKEFNTQKAQSLLREKEKEYKELEKRQQKFYQDVNSTIKTISNIGGFPISEKEKRELIDYAFVPEKDGLSKYQKEYGANVLNIIESAWLAKNRGKLTKVDDVKKTGSTDAYKTLRDKLKAKGKSNNDDNQKGKLVGSSLGDFGKGIIFK